MIENHRVRTQRLRVRVPGQQAAFEARAALRADWDARMAPALARAFDAVDTGGRTIHIPRLTVTLRVRSVDELSARLPEMLFEAVRDRLLALIADSGDGEGARAGGIDEWPSSAVWREALLLWLERGELPWVVQGLPVEALRDGLRSAAPELVVEARSRARAGTLTVPWVFRLLALLAPRDEAALILTAAPTWAAPLPAPAAAPRPADARARSAAATWDEPGEAARAGALLHALLTWLAALAGAPDRARRLRWASWLIVRLGARPVPPASARAILEALPPEERAPLIARIAEDEGAAAAPVRRLLSLLGGGPTPPEPWTPAARAPAPRPSSPAPAPRAEVSRLPGPGGGDPEAPRPEAAVDARSERNQRPADLPSAGAPPVAAPSAETARAEALLPVAARRDRSTPTARSATGGPPAGEIRPAGGFHRGRSHRRWKKRAVHPTPRGAGRTVPARSSRAPLEGPEEWVVHDAGLVLLHPYLGTFLELRGAHERGRAAIPEALRPRAAALLHALVTGQDDVAEHELALAKVLLGLDPEAPLLVAEGLLDADDLAAADELLTAAVSHWGALGRTSPSGLRGTFLRRDGRLRAGPLGSTLRVAAAPYDLLLDRLPWPISVVRTPWMRRPLGVEWRVG